LLSIRPVRGGAPHAKNNAKAVPINLIASFQGYVRMSIPLLRAFGIFLTGELKRLAAPPLLQS